MKLSYKKTLRRLKKEKLRIISRALVLTTLISFQGVKVNKKG